MRARSLKLSRLTKKDDGTKQTACSRLPDRGETRDTERTSWKNRDNRAPFFARVRFVSFVTFPFLLSESLEKPAKWTASSEFLFFFKDSWVIGSENGVILAKRGWFVLADSRARTLSEGGKKHPHSHPLWNWSKSTTWHSNTEKSGQRSLLAGNGSSARTVYLASAENGVTVYSYGHFVQIGRRIGKLSSVVFA